MGSKSFRTAAAKEKIEFDIEGGDGDEYEVFKEHFVCRGQIPGGLILEYGELSATMGVDQIGDADSEHTPAEVLANGARLLQVVREFFDAALSRKDRDRFLTLIKDPDRPVDIMTLMEIMNWLSSEFSARPTGESSSDSSSAMPTGLALTDGLSYAAPTYSRPDSKQAVSSA